MGEIGLFPLGVVLLPGERIPLHIFEPRYKELIGECLELGVPFGLVLADDSGMREVGTEAAVVDVLRRFEDGRLDVVGIFPDNASLIRLSTSLVIEQNDEWLVGRRYVSLDSLAPLLEERREHEEEVLELTAA